MSVGVIGPAGESLPKKVGRFRKCFLFEADAAEVVKCLAVVRLKLQGLQTRPARPGQVALAKKSITQTNMRRRVLGSNRERATVAVDPAQSSVNLP